jgi:nitrite reductase/ring-hydroxylating ferredoxin subunit
MAATQDLAADATGNRIFVARSGDLAEGSFLHMDIRHAGEEIAVLIFRHRGRCLAYRNLCVHMPRRLDCEQGTIFDETGRYLRCSMHGILYEPASGESISEICFGKRLTPIQVAEDGDGIWIVDRLASAAQAVAGS